MITLRHIIVSWVQIPIVIHTKHLINSLTVLQTDGFLLIPQTHIYFSVQ